MQIESVATKAGRSDLRGGVEDRLAQRPAHLQMAIVVLDLDRRIVHQDSDRQRQARPAS